MAPSKDARVSDTPTLSLLRLGRSPLIGRKRELAILSEQLAEARAGHCVDCAAQLTTWRGEDPAARRAPA
jgi:hypothetical protein